MDTGEASRSLQTPNSDRSTTDSRSKCENCCAKFLQHCKNVRLLWHMKGTKGLQRQRLLREKVWFPCIDQMTDNAIKRCVPCQSATPRTAYEPLNMTPLPETPWRELSTDFYGPLPTGEYLLVIIDEYSRYPVVEILRSTSANTVIPVFDKVIPVFDKVIPVFDKVIPVFDKVIPVFDKVIPVFDKVIPVFDKVIPVFDKVMSMFGIPGVLKSDNGPPFNSVQLQSFAAHMGFKHRKVTPYWPRANGEAERFMRNLGKVVKAASSEGKPWKQELNKFLRNYRATPHTITNMSPFAALFGREMKMKLPALSRPNASDMIRDADDIAKARMKLLTIAVMSSRVCCIMLIAALLRCTTYNVIFSGNQTRSIRQNSIDIAELNRYRRTQ